MPISLFVETFKGPGVAADTRMPTATPLATPIAPISAIPTMPVSVVPTIHVSVVPSIPVSAVATAPILTSPGELLFPYLLLHYLLVSLSFLDHGFSYHTSHFLLGPFPTIHSQFEMSSSSATVPNPVSEAIAFFTCFDQLKVNDLDPANFWGSVPPYVDFHNFRVPEDCASHLEAIYNSRGDFM